MSKQFCLLSRILHFVEYLLLNTAYRFAGKEDANT